MKKISVLIPTYNEQENVAAICAAILDIFVREIPHHACEIIFIDNASTDDTRVVIEHLCNQHTNVRAIFNNRNVGMFNSQFYGLCQTTGDATILINADFQEPVELLPQFVQAWEEGYPLVAGIKTSSKENPLLYFLRTVYYRLLRMQSSFEQIEHFTGFGLYDNSVVQLLCRLKDPAPFLRGMVAELGFKRKDIPYRQAQRRAGKTKHNWYKLYDMAMLGFTSYTKGGLRIATFAGFFLSVASAILALVTLIIKLVNWQHFQVGIAAIIIGIFFFGSVQIFLIGLLGEYLINLTTRSLNHPLVVEEKRINFPTRPAQASSPQSVPNKASDFL